jgi:hypothetical protein
MKPKNPVTFFARIAVVALAMVGGYAASAAHVVITQDGSVYHVAIDGKPFGDYFTGADMPKPFFAPLRSASGKIVTRRFPMENDHTESSDHVHHRGLWLGYILVNGDNFWDNEFVYHHPNNGLLKTRSVAIKRNGELDSVIDWTGPDGATILTENRILTIRGDKSLRIVDFDSTLTAAGKVVFGDDKDGAFAVRVADALTEKKGGVITTSAGKRTMAEAWGKPANWADYSGTIDGEKLGIAIFDHPSSFHHPTRWHARDYGLLAANPFADHAYDPASPERAVTLEKGEKIHLKYRVVIHPEMDSAAIEKLYQEYAK